VPEPVVEFREDEQRRVHFKMTPFEEDFLNTSVKELCKLLCAANYLDIPSLFLYGCQKAAVMMEGKEQDELDREWERYY